MTAGAFFVQVETHASGWGSVATGWGSLASGLVATAMGWNIVANGTAETVVGVCNAELAGHDWGFGAGHEAPTGTLFRVGNGPLNTTYIGHGEVSTNCRKGARSDALRVYADGRCATPNTTP
jgi:hypothetical protein